MTGEWGTGVKERGDPCSSDDLLVATEEEATAGPGEGMLEAELTVSAVVVEGLGEQQQQQRQQQQQTQPQGISTSNMGAEAEAEAGGAADAARDSTDKINASLEDKGGVHSAKDTAAAGTAESTMQGRVGESESVGSTSQGRRESRNASKPETKRGAGSGGIDDTLVRTPGTASLSPHVLSDAIVAAYQRGFQQGLHATSGSGSGSGSGGAVPPQSPIRTTMSAEAATVRGRAEHSASSSSLPSPFRGELVPSLGLASPMSPGFGGPGGGVVGAGLMPPSPYATLGPAHGPAHGVAFRVPPSRIQGPTWFGGGATSDTAQLKGEPDASQRCAEEGHPITGAAAVGETVAWKGGDDGTTDDGYDDEFEDDDDDDDDDRSVTVKKRERARARANNRKGYIDMIAQKRGKDMTEYERNELRSWEERRDRKNNRSRERSMEKKSRIRQILDTPAEERSEADAAFLREYQERRHRKNEGDRLRRERIRKMAGCGPKPQGVTVTARGPIKLPTGQVVEREEDAVAVLGEPHPSSERSKARPRKRKSDAEPTDAATVDPNVQVGASPFVAAGFGQGVTLPHAFLPPQPPALFPGQAALLSTPLYPHYAPQMPPKASIYAGRRVHGGEMVQHPSLMAMHRMRPVSGGSGLGSLPYPPFLGGHGGVGDGNATAPSSMWSASNRPPLEGTRSMGRYDASSSTSLPQPPPPPPPPTVGAKSKRDRQEDGRTR